MATVPNPRSFQQIYGDLVSGFTSYLGIPTIRTLSPLDALFIAVGESELRQTQDVMTGLASDSLSRAKGTALNRVGADEDVARQTQTAASGPLTLGDSRFAKVATKLFQGLPAPIVGSTTLYLFDASAFPATGSVYLGRGTGNYEGPIAYTAKASFTTYWTVTLTTGTTKFHNVGESVVLAQGGNRTFPAGTIAQTAQGNFTTAATFKTLFAATIPDGETSVSGVVAVCTVPGLAGNAPANTVKVLPTPPFVGATVTNPTPFSNALATWDDQTYQEAIRDARNSRSKGTALAVRTAAVGVTSPDEQKSVVSASLVSPQGAPATLYVDDGTGYEEVSQGIAYESLTDDAAGGEQFFATAYRPVTKANVVSTLSAPFALADGMVLTVAVGGVPSTHTFSAASFRSVGNAAADEVCASINGDPSCLFYARPVAGDTQVALVAISDSNEDLAVVASASDVVDANSALGFPTGDNLTLALYRNDRLLSKDGAAASVTTTPKSTWLPMSSPQTVTVAVDGTPAVTYTLTDADFVDAQTGYSTLAASNSLAAWAAVLNARIPGVTATVGPDDLVLTSNLGPSSRGQVAVTGGTLESAGRMFSFPTAAGLVSTARARDYTLNRNTGQIGLTSRLAGGDKLTVGTLYPRAFVESAPLGTFTTTAEADLWFVVDGAAQLVPVGALSGATVTFSAYVTTPPETWGDRVRVTASSGAGTFGALLPGDWAIFLDSNFSSGNRGAWRVAYVDAAGAYFEVERSTFVAETKPLTGGGIAFVRTAAQVQKVAVPAAANYTAATVVDSVNSQLLGATASTYRTTQVRVRTDSAVGDVALVAQNTQALTSLGFTTGSAVNSAASKLAAVTSAAFEAGTPYFTNPTVASVASTTQFTGSSAGGLDTRSFAVFGRDLPDTDSSAPRSRFGTNAGYRAPVTALSGSTVTVRLPALEEFLPQDRFRGQAPFAVSAADDFTVLVDQDVASKRYAFSAYRRCSTVGTTYGSSIALNDLDNSSQPLSLAFGTSFDWQDFSAWMRARAKSHAESGDTTKTVLWRYYRYGPDGDQVKLRYVYPAAANQAVTVTSNPNAPGFSAYSLVQVSLPSGAPRTGYSVRNSTYVGVMASAGSGGLQNLTYLLGLSISSAVRVVQVDYTGRGTTAFSGTVTGGTSGATATVVSDSLAGGLSGSGTLTLSGVTGSFVSGETITGTSGSATTARAQYGLTTLTLDVATPGATAHGFSPGNQLWVQSTSGSFSTGLKSVKSTTSTTVSYEESNSAAGTTPSIGDVSFDSAGEAKFSGSSIVTGDVASWGAAGGLPAGYEVALRVATLGAQYLKGPAESANATGTVPTWYPLGVAASFSAYPIAATSNTAAQVAAAVNAIPNCPVSAVAVGLAGVATGQVTEASWDEFSTAGYAYSLTDGVNSVLSNSTPPNTSTTYTFTLKDAVTSSLATNSDWANDQVRLVPVDAEGVAEFFGSLGVSGLGSVAEVSVADQAGSVQILSETPGSAGSVQVQGGSANNLTAAVVGSAALTTDSLYSFVTARAVDTAGLAAGMWVDLRNARQMPKATFSSGTTLVSVDAAGNFVLSGTQAWTYANSGATPVNGFTWQVEQQSRYTCFAWDGVGSAPSLTGVQEGDWVVVSQSAYSISGRNTGTFRVVRVDTTSTSFWVENPSSVPEVVSCALTFLAYDSIMVGDQVAIGTPVWGAGNVGTWTVRSIGPATSQFAVSGTTQAVTGPVSLGSSSPLVQCYEGSPTKLVKRVLSVTQDPVDPTRAQVKFTTPQGYRNIGAAAGTVVYALDKLAFPTSVAQGSDGYAHSVGLVGEVNRVLYGDESAPDEYPGVVAFDSNVNVVGPNLLRVSVALGLRYQAGVTISDVDDRVKSAVAAFVNSLDVGRSVPISGIVAAATKVNGVAGVVVISPAYAPGEDQIAVQPGQKALVLDPAGDVSISQVGG